MGPRYVKILGKNHSKCMTEFIQDSWHKECYLNVKFVCKDSGSLSRGTLFANKAVLAAGSKTLYQLLSDTGDEDVTIFVPESDFHTIKMLLHYIYTGQVLVESILDELQSLILDWDVAYPQVISVGTTRKLKPTSNDEDPLSLDTFDQNTRNVEEVDIVSPSGCDSSFEDHSAVLSAPLHEIQGGMTKNGESSAEERNKGIADNHNVEKKKRAKRKANVNAIQLDAGAEDDTEEDKADLLLSQAFLQKEKTRTLQLNSTKIELKTTIQRHQLYLKHFKGVNLRFLPQIKARVKVKRIPCTTCGKEVKSYNMKCHMETVHNSGERPYLCEQCGASFVVNSALKSHVRNVHGTNNRPHICTVCNKGFKIQSALKYHMSVHTGEKPFQCTYCDKKFRTRMNMVKHEIIHTGERPYGPCKFCGLWFPYRSTYNKHLLTHSGQSSVRNNGVDPETRLFKCNTCGLTFNREYMFLIHEATHRKEDPKLPCPYCPNTFPSMKLLKKHSQSEHPEKYFRCDQCPSFFVKKQNFDDHMLSHSNQAEKFPCSECGKEFPTKQKLNIHVKQCHSTVFHCQFCSKKLKTKISLVDHERIHTGERPFGCPHCSKFFRVKVHLENHIRIHTGEKPFICIHCGKAFSAKHNMDIHIKLHTGKKNQCSKCGETFRSLLKLQQHQETHSNQEEEEERDSDSVSDDEEDQ